MNVVETLHAVTMLVLAGTAFLVVLKTSFSLNTQGNRGNPRTHRQMRLMLTSAVRGLLRAVIDGEEKGAKSAHRKEKKPPPTLGPPKAKK